MKLKPILIILMILFIVSIVSANYEEDSIFGFKKQYESKSSVGATPTPQIDEWVAIEKTRVFTPLYASIPYGFDPNNALKGIAYLITYKNQNNVYEVRSVDVTTWYNTNVTIYKI